MEKDNQDQLTRALVILEALQNDVVEVKNSIKEIKNEYVSRNELSYIKESIKGLWFVIGSLGLSTIGLIINAIGKTVLK